MKLLRLLPCMLVLLILSCQESNNTKLPEYTILRVAINNRVKTVADVRIKERLLEGRLRTIAQKVKSEIGPKSDRVHIFFLLPEMELDNGAWAAADFEPEINIRYIGAPAEEQTAVNLYMLTQSADKYLGQWEDRDGESTIILRMIKTNTGYKLEYYSPVSDEVGPLPTLLKVQKTKDGETRYVDIESSFDEYYTIDKNGDLAVYDNKGFIERYKKLEKAINQN